MLTVPGLTAKLGKLLRMCRNRRMLQSSWACSCLRRELRVLGLRVLGQRGGMVGEESRAAWVRHRRGLARTGAEPAGRCEASHWRHESERRRLCPGTHLGEHTSKAQSDILPGLTSQNSRSMYIALQ